MDRKLIEDYEEFFKGISKEKTELLEEDYRKVRNYESRIEWVQKYVDNIFKIELIEKTYSKEFEEYMKRFRK